MPTIVNGRDLAQKIKSELKTRVENLPPIKLAVLCVGGNEITKKYIDRKIGFGEDMGIDVLCFDLLPDVDEEEVISLIQRLNSDVSITAVVVQLPLPKHLNTENILSVIDPIKDADALSPDPIVNSPVVLAIETILEAHSVNLVGQKIIVIGNGRLVGRPVSIFLAQAGLEVVQFDVQNKNGLEEAVATADVIISGAGVANLIRPNMLKRAVVLIDAATSELDGKIVGDTDPACAEMCSIYTPVPGGVGPLTIACLFKNVVFLKLRQA